MYLVARQMSKMLNEEQEISDLIAYMNTLGDQQLAALEQRAIGGELEAQYQLGTYYLVRHEPAAADWICQAANLPAIGECEGLRIDAVA